MTAAACLHDTMNGSCDYSCQRQRRAGECVPPGKLWSRELRGKSTQGEAPKAKTRAPICDKFMHQVVRGHRMWNEN
jgi:hypothetical protein